MKSAFAGVCVRSLKVLALVLLLATSGSPLLFADCARQRVELGGLQDQLYSIAVDEEAGIAYLRSETKRDILIMLRIDPENPRIFVPFEDQSPLEELNKQRPIGQHSFASYGGEKYLYFVKNPRRVPGTTPDIMVARLDQGKWRVTADLQKQLAKINSPAAEMTPFVAEGGKALYFTSDSDRTRRTCDPFMQFLSGFCWRIYKATRKTIDEPFELRGDGKQVLPSGCLDLYYDECWSAAAAPSLSETGVLVFNSAPLPGRFKQGDFDNIWRTEREEDGTFRYPSNMSSINLIENEPIKEVPSITPSGKNLYWFSGTNALKQSPYHLSLGNIADRDQDGFDDCVDLDDRDRSVYPEAPEDLDTIGTDNDVDGFKQDVDLYVSIEGADDQQCGGRTKPCRSIQYGINKVQDGSIVYVLPGLYREHVRIVGKWLSLVSTEGPEQTTILGVRAQDPVVKIEGFRNFMPLLLKGFTIRGVEAAGKGKGKGGGLYIKESTISVVDNVIRDNRSARGGGIYLDNARGRIIHNVIVNNSAETGGGILVSGGDYHMGRVLQITDNIIVKNRGGGIYLSSPYRRAKITPPLIIRNNVWSNEEGDVKGCSGCEAEEVARSNLSVDPQFKEGTLRLKETSPCRKAGALFRHTVDKRSDLRKPTWKVRDSSDIGLLENGS
jgi:hypothetical protein